jgi:hypothetical protein
MNVMNSRRLMPVPEGQTRHSTGLSQHTGRGANVRFGSLADILRRNRDVCFTPNSGHGLA